MYGTVNDADAYHLARGNAAWTGTPAVKEAALVRASDYIDGRYRYKTAAGCWKSMFRGVRAGGRTQTVEWPRFGAFDSEGNDIADDVIPDEIERATYAAALVELVSPGSLSPEYVASGQVKREKVGPVEVEYSGTATAGNMPPNRPVVPLVDDIIAGLICDRPPYCAAVRVV